jgi:hypothetical protein
MIASAARPLRVARIVQDGQSFYPVFEGSRMLGLEELQDLAREPEATPPRLLSVVLLDEGAPRSGLPLPTPVFEPYELTAIRCPDGTPVTYLDTPCTIGDVQRRRVYPADFVDRFTFPATRAVMLGTVELARTRLAGLAWTAVRRGWFSGVCCELAGDRIIRVILGDLTNSCLEHCAVVGTIEGGLADAVLQDIKRLRE